MNKLRYILSVAWLLVIHLLPVRAAVPDSVDVKVLELTDSMEITITAFKIETQLAFLMQGVKICLIQPDTVTVMFPSAPMVRDIVKRHPNEVKAMLAMKKKQHETEAGYDGINHVVRPDVQPLVAALNDTTAMLMYHGCKVFTRAFSIDVEREKALVHFSIKVPRCYIDAGQDTLCMTVCSVPTSGDRKEFTGKRLTDGNSPHPNGLGEGFRKEDAASRTFQQTVTVEIIKSNKDQ